LAISAAASEPPSSGVDLTAVVQILIKKVERWLRMGQVKTVRKCGSMHVVEEIFQLALHVEIMPEMR
jgi:peptidyl-tRNA hydrolase